jgi:hypothetical protein
MVGMVFGFGNAGGGGPRRTGLWLLFALLLWLAATVAQRQTRVEVVSDGSRIVVDVAGSTASIPLTIESLQRIEIRAMDSVDPPGGRALELVEGEHVVLVESLPPVFQLPPGRIEPLGDWELDEFAGSGVVYSREVDVTGPFTLRAGFTGRFLHHLTVTLHGSPTCTISFRRGWINNDLFIWDADGVAVASTSIDPQPGVDLMAVLTTLARAGAAAALLTALFTLTTWLPTPQARASVARSSSGGQLGLAAAVVLGAAAAGLSIWVARAVLEALPHFPDTVVYVLQAKWLLAGRLYQELSTIQEHLTVPFTYVTAEGWLAHYPFGWPALLSVGLAVGKPWLVAPVLGGLYTVLLYLVGRELYSRGLGLMTAALAVVSPISCLLFASLLSHAAGATLILLSLWLMLVARRRQAPWLTVIAGLALGFAFGIRPLAAVAVAVPVLAFVLFDLRRPAEAPRTPWLFAGTTIGIAIGLVPTLIANRLITGSFLSFPYSLAKGSMYSIENWPFGLRNMDVLLASSQPALFGWGWGYAASWFLTALPLAVVLVPILLRRLNSYDVLLLACFATLVLLHLGTRAHGLHGFGPRYYFDGFFALYLLAARGFQELARIGVGPDVTVARPRYGSPAFLMAATLFVTLNASALLVLPQRLESYRGYNRVDGALVHDIQQLDTDRALVLFGESDWRNWAMASPLMAGDGGGNFVFGQDLEDNAALFRFAPDRPAYLWLAGKLEPLARSGEGARD